MFSRIRYFVRETFVSVGRNWAMALAGVSVIMVTMMFAGAGLLYSAWVSNGTQRWKDGARLEVFMTVDASQQQVDAVQAAIKSSPDVKSVKYISKRDAYSDFKRIFNDQPELVNSINQDSLPVSFRVTPRKAELTNALGTRFEQLDGVDETVTPGDVLEAELKRKNGMTRLVWGLSIVLFLTSGVIVATTIRLATFARRREIEVMKLVGASNWFVRVPFISEGVLQGFIGGAIASTFLYVIARLWFVADPIQGIFARQGYAVTSSDIVVSVVVLMAGSIAIGLISSLVGLWRFLDV
jgi:cell division transport system permease protein